MKKFPITEAVLRWLESTLAERFSNVWRLSQNDSGLSLQLVGAEGLILFDSLCKGFSHASSDLPFTSWAAEQEGWKSVLGDPLPAPGIDVIPSPLIEEVNEDYVIHYDILGLMYWMLTRIEEVERNDLDEHGRFPAHSSHAFKYNYLDRPVVDEWLHILGQVIVRKWPSVTLKQHQFKMLISCDVDSPFALDGTISKMIRRAAGDILIRKAPNELYKTIVGTCYTICFNLNIDQHRQGINFIMEVNERYDRKVAFYFISKISHPTLDNCFNLNSKSMRKILKFI